MSISGNRASGATLEVIQSCLGYLPEFAGSEMPELYYDDRLGSNFEGSGAEPVSSGLRHEVSRQVASAFTWCIERFPISSRDPATGGLRPTVTALCIGRSLRAGRLLSASSPQAPGIIFLAADWPLRTPYRLASLIAHESIHQALYAREAQFSPVRPSSLGYSPWKNTLRPGRWVWHAFWTFSFQLTMLGEAIHSDRPILAGDSSLLGFVADMYSRVGLCLRSLEDSDIVTRPELERCQAALAIVDLVAENLADVDDFGRVKAMAEAASFREFRDWALMMVSQSADSRG